MPAPMGRNRNMNQPPPQGGSGGSAPQNNGSSNTLSTFIKKWWWAIAIILIGIGLFSLINDGITTSQSVSQITKESNGTTFNWWSLFPFAIVAMMIIIIFYVRTAELSIGAILLLIGTIIFFWYNRHWFTPGLDMVTENIGAKEITSEFHANESSGFFQKETPQEKARTAIGGNMVSGVIKKLDNDTSHCKQLIKEIAFEPKPSTHDSKPELVISKDGTYLLETKGVRQQPYYAHSYNETPAAIRSIDADGYLVDNNPPDQFISNDQSILVPRQPHGALVMKTSDVQYIIVGSSYKFQSIGNNKVKLDINVTPVPANYKGTGKLTVKLLKCSE